jgi:hypothetical protein
MVDITGLTSTALEFIRNAFSTVKHYIKEVGVYVKDVGRVTLRYGYELATFFGDPAKGVPIALAVYLGSKYVTIDVSGVLQWIDIMKERLKGIRFAETVDTWIKNWIASWLNIDPTLPYWQLMNPAIVWNGLYNAYWAPHWVAFGIDFAIPLLAIIFVPIYIFIAILGAVIALCYLLQWLYYLLVDFSMLIFRYVIEGFAWIWNNVVSFVGMLACNYLKIMMPVVPVVFVAKFAGKGLKGMLAGTIIGTLGTWIAIQAFAPECSLFQPVATVTPVPPSPPEYVSIAEVLTYAIIYGAVVGNRLSVLDVRGIVIAVGSTLSVLDGRGIVIVIGNNVSILNGVGIAITIGSSVSAYIAG